MKQNKKGLDRNLPFWVLLSTIMVLVTISMATANLDVGENVTADNFCNLAGTCWNTSAAGGSVWTEDNENASYVGNATIYGNGVTGLTIRSENSQNATITMQNGELDGGDWRMDVGADGYWRMETYRLGDWIPRFTIGDAFYIEPGTNLTGINGTFENITTDNLVVMNLTVQDRSRFKNVSLGYDKGLNGKEGFVFFHPTLQSHEAVNNIYSYQSNTGSWFNFTANKAETSVRSRIVLNAEDGMEINTHSTTEWLYPKDDGRDNFGTPTNRINDTYISGYINDSENSTNIAELRTHMDNVTPHIDWADTDQNFSTSGNLINMTGSENKTIDLHTSGMPANPIAINFVREGMFQKSFRMYLNNTGMHYQFSVSDNGNWADSFIFNNDGQTSVYDFTADRDLTVNEDLTVAGSITSKPLGYLSLTTTSDSTASASKYDVFDEDNYGTYTKTDNIAANNITYTSTDGKFLVNQDGIYDINIVLSVISSSSQFAIVSVELNGGDIFSHQIYVHSGVDPIHYPINLIKDLSTDDYINVKIDSVSTQTMQINDGSGITMKRLV